MRYSTVIKTLHRTLTLVLLLLVVCFAIYQYMLGKPYDDRLYASKQLNENTWLYVTHYQGGNATVSDVFRYYLSGELSGDPLKAVGEMKPFLMAETGTAVVTKIGRLVTVHVKGKIYNFTNSVMYTSKDTAVFPVIELYASGEWRR
ncbi:hypothetical protein [Leclercia adecarboxylata]|uniref:hypothetical protein n=1 Tax=Leclercia adecarboxylata TaxID=83655 RepID=UPI00370C3156